jgi:predicted transcriptional regulator
MNTQLTINLRDDIAVSLNKMAAKDGVSQNEIVSEALENYLFIRKFRLLRERMIKKTDIQYTDEQVFELVS